MILFKRLFLSITAPIQILLFCVAFVVLLPFSFRKRRKSWVFGVHEIAKNIHYLGFVYTDSYTVNLYPHIFYNTEQYSYRIRGKSKTINLLKRTFLSPLLLAFFIFRVNGFWYISEDTFLTLKSFELFVLKRLKKKIVWMFCGSEIRSYEKFQSYAAAKEIDHLYTYLNREMLPSERTIQKRVKLTETYADFILSYPVGQISYFKRKVYRWPYMMKDDQFQKNIAKFSNPKKIKIVHAPSNPLLKGTPLVRAAIKKLTLENYPIEYIELQGKDNKWVLNELNQAHIVLNQFYNIGAEIGLFGIEAMANYTCLLSSFDPQLSRESAFLEELNTACVHTRYWEIYNKLKWLLDNPQEIQNYADRGFQYTYNNFHASNARRHFDAIIE